VSAAQATLSHGRDRANAALERWLAPAEQAPERLHAAMRYAVLGTGKRLRPALVYAAGDALGAPAECLDPPACAVELIHAYSLVHDDLPAMDDDDLRRGAPTCHKAFDEATAILAGDALQALAFELITAAPPAGVYSAATRGRLAATLARAVGAQGMAGGQALDLDACGHQIALADLERMHRYKTGALIQASVVLGALAGDADESVLAPLERFGEAIGLDEFRLSPTFIPSDQRKEGEDVLGLAAEAGIDLSDRLSFSVLTIFNSDQPLQYGLRYRLNDNTVLRGATDFSGDNRAAIEYNLRF